MKVSIVLPAYNEARRLEHAVDEVKKWMDEMGYDYEIIIAEDGSTDGTDKIASMLAKEDPKVKHLHSDERLGRGKALSNAFKVAEGDILVYLDVDLSTDMKHLKELIDSIAIEGYDIATGSRLMKDSEVERPLKRLIASKVYNLLVKIILGSRINDHQCGFKAFKRDVILNIIKYVKDNHWFWDTEVLVLAQRMGYKIKEIPVKWKQSEDTKVKFVKDIIYMFSQILRMWIESKKSRKFIVFSIILSVLLLIGIAWFAGFSVEILARIDAKYITLALAIYFLSFIVRGFRYKYMLSKLGYDVSIWFSIKGVSISQMMNVIIPARLGDFTRIYIFKLKNVPITAILSSLAVERVFDLLSVIIIAIISTVFLGILSLTPVYGGILLTFIVIAIVLLAKMENIIGKIFKDAKKIIKFNFPVIAILSLIIWFIEGLICYIVLIAFGFHNIILPFLAVSISNIIKALPITPGGIGPYEATMTGILSIEIEPSFAFTVALIEHTIKNLLTIVFGFVSLTLLNIKLKDIIKSQTF